MVEMKESGIAWVGDIPFDWEVQKGKYCLKYIEKPVKEDDDVITCFRDGEVTLRKNRREDGFTISEKEIGYQGIDVGDLIVHGMDGFAGAIGISDSRGKASPVLNVLDTTHNKKFIMYYLRNMAYNGVFIALATGIRVRTCDTNWGKLKELPYILPPRQIQDRIVQCIDNRCAEIDAISSEIQEQINTLEEYKKSLIKELLDNYLNTNKHIYSKLRHLSKLVTKQTGFDYSNIIQPSLVGELTENTIPYLQTRHFKDNYFNFDTEYYVPKSVARLFPQITLNKKCLLFSIVGASIGNIAIFPATQEAFLGGAVCKVDLINEQLYDYIKHYMMSIYGQEQILTKINASAQGTITVQNVRDFKIPIFENEQVYLEFSNKANKISSYVYSAIADKQKQLETLEEYKKTLIYEYVTGKKEVV